MQRVWGTTGIRIPLTGGNFPATGWAGVALLCLLLAGCKQERPPSITFAEVPMASLGGSDTSGTISGRVSSFKPGQRIVIYASSGGDWWVQPYSYAPFTDIKPDGSWSAQIHLGMQYAALLVNTGYRVATVIPSLPTPGKSVVTIATVPATEAPLQQSKLPAKTLHFSGYDWEVRTTAGEYGGKSHYYVPDNVWVDGDGAMHLRVSLISNQHTCAEAHLVRPLAYGTYQFKVRNVQQLEPAAMFSMFTWTDGSPQQQHREMDIHVSRWGNPASKNAEFVIQPYYLPANVYRYEMPAGPLTTSLRWMPETAAFTTTRGDGEGKPIAAWNFTSGVPRSQDETIHVNLCEFGYAKLPMQREAEVVIDRFQFLP